MDSSAALTLSWPHRHHEQASESVGLLLTLFYIVRGCDEDEIEHKYG